MLLAERFSAAPADMAELVGGMAEGAGAGVAGAARMAEHVAAQQGRRPAPIVCVARSRIEVDHRAPPRTSDQSCACA